jgi:mannose-6-phosphate isomerase-like protein (cupin superfamily)
MKRMKILVASVVVLVAIAARAQAPAQPSAVVTNTADFIAGDVIAAKVSALMDKAKTSANGNTSELLMKYSNHYINLNARVKSGSGEFHSRWNDIFVVLEGEATEVTGGTIPGMTMDAATGEGHGEKVVGGVEHVLHAGDVLHINAATPHQMLIAPGKSFAYLVIKVAPGTAAEETEHTSDYFSADKVSSGSDALLEKAKNGASGSASVTVKTYPEHFVNLSARVKSGGGEFHTHYNDVFVVLSGEATEITGGTIPDMKLNADTGEGSGATIVGGTPHKLTAGDVLHISPATPHQTIMEPGKTFTAIVVKVHAE